MNVNKTLIGVLLLAAVAVAAYQIGRQQTTTAPESAAAPETAPARQLPAGHTTVPAAVPEHAKTITSDKGIKFTHFRVGNRNVKALLSDGNIIWVGTSGGVIRYNTETDQYRLFDTKSGLLSNGIFHLSKLGDRLLVGTYGGGMSLFDAASETWETFNIPDGLADAFVYDVLETDKGDVWVATWSGANFIRGGALKERDKWEVFTVENTDGGLPNDWVYGLAAGRNGEIWMATEGGLARFVDGVWSHWKHSDGLGADYDTVKKDIQFKDDPGKISSHHARQKVEQGLQGVDVAYNPNYIVALQVDRDGVVWCGTWGGGLARFDGKKWRNFTMDDGLPGNHVFMLHMDSDGTLWIGTNNGLARYNGKTFETFTVNDGLFSNYVFSMTDTPDGSLWVGSFGGVARLRMP